MLTCESCGKRIEELTEDEQLEDLEGHGFLMDQASHFKCYDCASDYDDYETYYAGRIKGGHHGKIFQMMPDIQGENPDKLIEVYSASVKDGK